MEEPRFLVIGDIKTFCEPIKGLLVALDYDENSIHVTTNSNQALLILESGTYNLIIADIEADSKAIDLANSIKPQNGLNNISVILAIPDDEESVQNAVTSGASSYETKPISKESLKRTIKKILNN